MTKGNGLQKLNVLTVDDSEHMRRIILALLMGLGFGFDHIFTAKDGVEALEILKSGHIDLVITDHRMPVLDGIDFTRLVRSGADSPNPYIPVIMLTAHADVEHIQAARDAGVSEFLRKPVNAQALYQRIAAVVEKPRAFIKSSDYNGPDRRRRNDPGYNGPERRSSSGIVMRKRD